MLLYCIVSPDGQKIGRLRSLTIQPHLHRQAYAGLPATCVLTLIPIASVPFRIARHISLLLLLLASLLTTEHVFEELKLSMRRGGEQQPGRNDGVEEHS
jgi:hypothetical protein